MMFKPFRLIAAILALTLGLGTGANAVTVSFYNDSSVPSGQRGWLQITGGAFEVLLTAAVGSATGPAGFITGTSWGGPPVNGQLFTLQNAGEATERAFVNGNLNGGGPFTAADQSKTSGGPGVFTFTSLAQYILIKIGTNPDTLLIHNTSGLELTLKWMPKSGAGAGLSHYTEFGGAVPIPLPAAGWLMLAGLGGLVVLRRRSKSA